MRMDFRRSAHVHVVAIGVSFIPVEKLIEAAKYCP